MLDSLRSSHSGRLCGVDQSGRWEESGTVEEASTIPQVLGKLKGHVNRGKVEVKNRGQISPKEQQNSSETRVKNVRMDCTQTILVLAEVWQ